VTARTGTIAFVPPRFGEDVVGGAESVLAEVAAGLAERGWSVEILTTCARDHYTWANHYPAGVSTSGPVVVRRFPTVVDTPGEHRWRVHQLITARRRPTITEQQLWLNDTFRCPGLFDHLLDHATDYRAVVTGPYLAWTTFATAAVAPDRTILMPCLHDEPEVHLDVYEPMLSGARGIWFLSEPERDLARRVVPGRSARTEVVGAPVVPPAGYDAASFRRRHGIDGPFVLYAGRREAGKGWGRLLEAFATAVRRDGVRLHLVTAGVGDPEIPADLAPHVTDLGFLSETDRNDAFAAATAVVQPSALESFSRVVMEAWLADTTVIANAGSAVVAWHVERSGAGLTYRNDEELIECLRLVAEQPDLVAGLAAPGRAYVTEHYLPERVLDRMEATLSGWTTP
jgi:glycosyltransferase involved in cell wall biosynthesis